MSVRIRYRALLLAGLLALLPTAALGQSAAPDDPQEGTEIRVVAPGTLPDGPATPPEFPVPAGPPAGAQPAAAPPSAAPAPAAPVPVVVSAPAPSAPTAGAPTARV